MIFDFKFFIAMRYLKSRKKGVFAFLTSIIAVAGVAVGVGALVITLSVMNGFKADIQEKILGTQSHVIVTNITDGEMNIPNVVKKIEKFAGVDSAAPFVYGQGILKTKKQSVGSVVKGVDPESEIRTSNLEEKIIKGSVESLKDVYSNNIVLGYELARNLGAQLGDDVVLVSPFAIETPFGSVPQMEAFKVSGIFHVGMYEFDANLAYISLEKAQKLFNLRDSVSGFGVKIDNIYKAERVSDKLGVYMGSDYWVRSWIQMNRNLFSALKLEKIVMFIILALIVLVAAFNIISNLFMMTMEKYKDIGILRALGAKISDIKMIFVIEGLITGILGIFFGSILGIGISFVIDKYKFIKLPAEVYYIDTLPVSILWSDILLVITVAVLIAFISTLYPAQKAAKVDPVEAIRYG